MSRRKAAAPDTDDVVNEGPRSNALGRAIRRDAKPTSIKAQRPRAVLTRRPTTMPVDQIRVGQCHRRDLGDIDALAASIAEVGLLHPVVVTRDALLIAGARRIAAFQMARPGEPIPVTVVDLDAVAKGEWAENTQRKDFTWTEAVAIKRALEPLEKAAAKERQREGARAGGKGSGKLPEASKGNASDKVAKAVGKKRRTLEKAEHIVEAAETNPQRYADLVERLEEDGARVDVIHRDLKQRQARAAYEATITQGCTTPDLKWLAVRGFRGAVMYVDAASKYITYSSKGKQRSAERYYDTMDVAELKAMAPLIQELAAKDCALLYWTSGPQIKNALEIIDAWGFTYSTWAFVWLKTNPSSGELTLETLKPEDLHRGTGHTTWANIEVVLLATRGSPMRLANDVNQVVIAPHPGPGRHSEKPEEVRRRIERLYAGPYLELFGREPVKGWTVWGNEIPRGRMTSGDEEPKRNVADQPASAQDDYPELPECLHRTSPTAKGSA